MAEQVRWAEVVWAEEPAVDRMRLLEEMYRAGALKQNGAGRAHPDMHYTVVKSLFSDLPGTFKITLEQTMRSGVKTGIPQPGKTVRSKASKTATLIILIKRNGYS